MTIICTIQNKNENCSSDINTPFCLTKQTLIISFNFNIHVFGLWHKWKYINTICKMQHNTEYCCCSAVLWCKNTPVVQKNYFTYLHTILIIIIKNDRINKKEIIYSIQKDRKIKTFIVWITYVHISCVFLCVANSNPLDVSIALANQTVNPDRGITTSCSEEGSISRVVAHAAQHSSDEKEGQRGGAACV